MGWMRRVVAVGALAGVALAFLPIFPMEASAQNLMRARLFRGGFSSGVPSFWVPAPNIDSRVWPPACGVKQGDATPATPCTVPYFGSHPANPIFAVSGMNGPNITFAADQWNLNFEFTVLGNPGFPFLIIRADENYGIGSFGPGLGAQQSGTITFNATGLDPADLGTQDFMYDPLGQTSPTGSRAFKWPPNDASTTPRPIPNPQNASGILRVVTGPERYGGTLSLTGVSNVFVIQTFNPGIATTGNVPVQHSSGSPIPVLTPTSGSLTIPGATFINRKKGVETNRIFTNMGITPGGLVDLGTVVQGSRNSFQMREQGPWTTGAITLTEMDRPGVFPTTTTRMDAGSKNTVGGVGTIQLVRPWVARSMNTDGGNGTAWSERLILDVPEPAAMLLLFSGVAGLILVAVIRRRAGSIF